ncbi:hypothetical protein TrispH2_000652 [Trichoplax sp. H2]|nr:hypothetical protein TrispH2_000652 [Trichoplax sp. H2]|eukprot:RDD47901.1 hypothetical protein TrispH2_000652 [Trichoplax sp. H2]
MSLGVVTVPVYNHCWHDHVPPTSPFSVTTYPKWQTGPHVTDCGRTDVRHQESSTSDDNATGTGLARVGKEEIKTGHRSSFAQFFIMEQKLVLILGAIQTITGIVSMILGVVTLFKATSNSITYISAPIWMGLLGLTEIPPLDKMRGLELAYVSLNTRGTVAQAYPSIDTHEQIERCRIHRFSRLSNSYSASYNVFYANSMKYFISGVLCVYTTSKKTYCMIGSLLLSSMVSLIASMGGIIVSAYGLTSFMNKLTVADANIAVVMYACILAITCLEAVCSSVMSVLCCRMAYVVRQSYQQEAFLYYGDVAITEPVIPPEVTEPPVYNPPAYRPPSPTSVYTNYVSPFEDVNTPSSTSNNNNASNQQSGDRSTQEQELLLDISTEDTATNANNNTVQETANGIQLIELNRNSTTTASINHSSQQEESNGIQTFQFHSSATSAFTPPASKDCQEQTSEDNSHDVETDNVVASTNESYNGPNSCNPFAPSDDEGKDSDNDEKLPTDDDTPLLQP